MTLQNLDNGTTQDIFLAGAECSALSGVPLRKIQGWSSSKEIRSNERGYGLISLLLKRLHELNNQSEDRLYLAKCRVEEARAEKIEMENERTKRKIVDTVQVVNDWKNLVLRLRSKLLAIPARVASEIDGKSPTEINTRLTAVIHEALRELAVDNSGQ